MNKFINNQEIYSLKGSKSLTKCYKGSEREEALTEAPSVLGYGGFPRHCASNPYFDSFIDGFKGLGEGGSAEFTELQMEMLDHLIACKHFQVTSPDINCGSGKTTLTVGATIGLLRNNHDRILVVARPGKDASPLTQQLEQLIAKFSGERASLGRVTCSEAATIDEVVAQNQVVFTSVQHIEETAEALIRYGKSCRLAPKVFMVFDESHQLFPSMPDRVLKQVYAVDSHDGRMAQFDRLRHLDQIRAFGRKRSFVLHEKKTAEEMQKEQRQQEGGLEGCDSCVAYALHQFRQMRPAPEPFLQVLYRTLRHMQAHRNVLAQQMVFISAGGEFKAGLGFAPSSDVISTLLRYWCGTTVHKVISAGANVDSARYTKVFRVHRSGAEQIGGVSPDGYPLVYEAMLSIALHWMVRGRLLFIVRAVQVDTFCTELQKRLVETRNSSFTFTSDKQYWNAVDTATGKPLYNIVIVREEELDDLEGVNFTGIKAVYLFSVGKVQHLLQKMQGLGRAGRIGQGYTYSFVLLDCTTRRNAAQELKTEEVMMDCLQNNSTYKPQVVNVIGSRVLQETQVGNVPRYTPEDRTAYVNSETFGAVLGAVQEANRVQVCPQIRCERGASCCPRTAKGLRCQWYHPTAADFVSPRTLPAAKFNISKCRPGAIFVSGSRTAAKSIAAVQHTVAPWAAAATAEGGEAVDAALLLAFPKLGDEAPAPAPSPAPATATRPTSHFLSGGNAGPLAAPRLATAAKAAPSAGFTKSSEVVPVCLYAVMGASKCRKGRSCPYRHPEIASHNVTAEEFREAKLRAMDNIAARKAAWERAGNAGGRSGAAPVAAAPSQSFASSSANYHPSRPTRVTVKVEEPKKPQKAKQQSADSSLLDAKLWVKAPTPAAAPATVAPSFEGEVDIWAVVNRPKKKVTKAATAAKASASAQRANPYAALQLQQQLEEEREQREEQEQKRLAAEEAQRLAEQAAKEAKEADERARKEEEEALAEAQAGMQEGLLTRCLRNGLKGEELAKALTDFCDDAEARPTAALLTTSALRSLHRGTDACGWTPVVAGRYCTLFKEGEFGAALVALVDGAVQQQVEVLQAVLEYGRQLQFPKVVLRKSTSSGGVSMALVDVLFRALYSSGVVDEEGLLHWADVGGDDDGKCIALVQLGTFLQWVGERAVAMQEAEDEDEEAVEVEPPTAEASCPAMSKEQRKLMKRERRSERVMQRGTDGQVMQ